MEDEPDLDPRIQGELENLNLATDDINKLEIELEEANTTFNILLNESTRRLKLLTKKLGNCIEKSRPYYDALEKSRLAQIECQAAAVKFRQANELYAAAKETVALAEQRFMSKSHEWQFDNAWQETLNYNTMKVMTAEKEKADCHMEHQRRAQIFSSLELIVQQFEDRFRRFIQKSRPYFEEKQICQDQLETQKGRIEELQSQIQIAKTKYSTSLRNLERISEEIHKMRSNNTGPPGPREPGVGAELIHIIEEQHQQHTPTQHINGSNTNNVPLKSSPSVLLNHKNQQQQTGAAAAAAATSTQSHDFISELEKCEIISLGGAALSNAPSTTISERDDDDDDDDSDDNINDYDDDDDDDIKHINLNNNNNNNNNSNNTNNNYEKNNVNDLDLEALRQRVKVLAVRPVEGGDGQQTQVDVWETELNDTVDQLDRLMMIREGIKPPLPPFTHHNNNSNNNKNNLSLPNSPRKTLSPALTKKKNTILASSSSSSSTGSPSSTVSALKITTAATTTTTTTISTATGLSSIDSPIKQLTKVEPLPDVNVSMKELPLLARLSNGLLERTNRIQNKRRLSLE